MYGAAAEDPGFAAGGVPPCAAMYAQKRAGVTAAGFSPALMSRFAHSCQVKSPSGREPAFATLAGAADAAGAAGAGAGGTWSESHAESSP